MIKATLHKSHHSGHFRVCYSVPLSRLTVSCDHCHCAIPECFCHPKTKPAPQSTCLLLELLEANLLHSVSIDRPVLEMSHKCNRTRNCLTIVSPPSPVSSPFGISHSKGQFLGPSLRLTGGRGGGEANRRLRKSPDREGNDSVSKVLALQT